MSLFRLQALRAWALACVAFVLSFSAGSALPAKQLKDVLNLGEHWYGPERSLRDLRGRVVLFEVWGLN